MMQPDAILINVARGGCIDKQVLCAMGHSSAA